MRSQRKNELQTFGKRQTESKKLAWYPRELQELLNLKTTLCPKCNTRCNSYHLNEIHKINIPENTELLKIVEEESLNLKRRGKSRKQSIQELGKIMDKYRKKIMDFLKSKE